MKPNIEHCNIKLDTVSPVIVTPWDSYEEYILTRSSVQIVVEEEDMERAVACYSHLLMEYMNSTGSWIREENKT